MTVKRSTFHVPRLTVILLLPFFLPLVARQPVPAWLGPEGGNAVYLAYDPQAAGVVYAGAWGAGVFRSDTGGQSWQPARAGLGGGYISALAVDPLNPGVVYAGVYYDGIYKSTNGGASWKRVSQGLKYPDTVIYDIEIDPTDPRRLYLATRASTGVFSPPWRGVVYRSLDGGESWQAVLENIGGSNEQDWCYSLALLPADPHILLAAAHEHGPYRSLDGGESWRSAADGITDLSARAILFDPAIGAPGSAFVGTWHYGGVFYTKNGADSWSNRGATEHKILKMDIDPANSSYIYGAVPDHGVLTSSNNGKNWSIAGLGNEYVQMVAVHPTNGTLLAATANGGIYRSPDHAKTWLPVNRGFITANVTALLVQPGAPAELFMATLGYGVLHSADGGATWQDFNAGMNDANVHGLLRHPANPNLLFALTGSSGLFRIDLNSAGQWQKLDGLASALALPPAANDPAASGQAPDASGQAPDALDADFFYTPQALPRPQAFPEAPAQAALLSLAFAPGQPQLAFQGLYGGGVRKSSDGSLHWSAAGLDGQTVLSLAIGPGTSPSVYAATGSAGSVWASSDQGTTWQQVGLPETINVNALFFSPHTPGLLYAATNNGLYTRLNKGPWQPAGLAGRAVLSLAFHPSDPARLWAGASDSAFTSEDGGAAWLPGPPQLASFRVQSITVDANDPRRLYYATDSGGVLKVYR